MKKTIIIAVDFDGTVVEHEYPLVGPDVPHAVETLRKLVAAGHKIILYTMRSHKELQDAVDWYAKHQIPLFGINENPDQGSWTSSQKVYAQIYIDDAALGVPLEYYKYDKDKNGLVRMNRPYVDWYDVGELLRKMGLIDQPQPSNI